MPDPEKRGRWWARWLTELMPPGQHTLEGWKAIFEANWSSSKKDMKKDGVVIPEPGDPEPPDPDPDPDPDPGDTDAPVISSVTATAGETQAVISWELDEPATGQVEYGTTTAYGDLSTREDSFDWDHHIQTLTGLVADTDYHYRVESTDEAGNTAVSGDYTFSTIAGVPEPDPDPPPDPDPDPDPPPDPDPDPDPPPAGTYPSKVTTQREMSLVRYSMPSYRQVHDDTTFGTEVTRVTSQSGWRNQYPSKPVWNIDQSLMCIDSGNRLLRGSDFTDLGATSFGGYFTWSAKDPTRGYSHNDGGVRVYTFNTSTGSQSTRSAPLGNYSETDWAGGQGKMSLNDEFAIMWEKGGRWGVAIWDADSETITWEKDLGSGGIKPDHCHISWSGRYAMTCSNDKGDNGYGEGSWAHDSQTGDSVHVANKLGHDDTMQDINGDDWHVFRASSSYFDHQGVFGYRYRDGLVKEMVGIGKNGPSALHISGTNYRRPGWFYMGSDYAGSGGYPLGGMVAAVNIANPSKVEVFSQTHYGGGGYDNECRGTASPDGTQFCWSTSWEGNNSLNAFVVGMDLGI